jgi:hypothetical protein
MELAPMNIVKWYARNKMIIEINITLASREKKQ